MRKGNGMRNSEGYFDPTAGIAERNVMKEQRGALPMTFNPDINRGDVFYVDRVQSYGHEQRAGRPAIVVSNDVNNAHSSVVEIVYLTTQPKTDMPTHVLVRATGIPSTALCEQVQTVDASRLGSFCGHCSATEMQAIDTALLVSLGLDMGGSRRTNLRRPSRSRRLSRSRATAATSTRSWWRPGPSSNSCERSTTTSCCERQAKAHKHKTAPICSESGRFSLI